MAARFGKVLYWAGCVLAALAIAAGAFLSFEMVQQSDALLVRIATLVVAVLFWLTGRACRYVFAES
jgi:hypothetical protein